MSIVIVDKPCPKCRYGLMQFYIEIIMIKGSLVEQRKEGFKCNICEHKDQMK